GGMVGARPAGQGQARNGRPGQPLREPAAWRPSPSTKISMSSSKRSSAYAMGAFALCAALSMLLPRTAVPEEALTEA
ncbi:MAG TPA: hypothetical protein VEF71_20195, partial [Streptosporangiaceae bacterium]|nr:hypothetical protein [Streptosporangiaceae bacterium]